MKGSSFVIIVLILLVPFIFAETTFNFLSKGQADFLYCARAEGCGTSSSTTTSVNATNFWVNSSNFFITSNKTINEGNVNVTNDLYVNSTFHKYGKYCDGTPTDCTTYLDEPTCIAQEGCFWDAVECLEDVALDCTLDYSPPNCFVREGCFEAEKVLFNFTDDGKGNFLSKVFNIGYNTIAEESNNVYAVGSENNLNCTNCGILIGTDNRIQGTYCYIYGGYSNTMGEFCNSGFIFGGTRNQINGNSAYLFAGSQNSANNAGAVVGGYLNNCSNAYSIILSGNTNKIDGTSSAIITGTQNKIPTESIYSIILSGRNNTITGTNFDYTEYTAVGGLNSNASGDLQFVYGNATRTNSYNNQICLGNIVTCQARNSFTYGVNIANQQNDSFKVGFQKGILNVSKDRVDIQGNITATQIYGTAWNHSDAGTTFVVGTAGVYYNVTFQNVTINGFTAGKNYFIPQIEGNYFISYHGSGSGVANHNYHMVVGRNGIAQYNTESHLRISNVNDVGSMAASGIIPLRTTDNVTLMVEDETGTGTATIYSIGITMFRIGDFKKLDAP